MERDIIELMKCRNCISFETKDNKHSCKIHNKPTNINDTCSYWEENINKKIILNEIYLSIKEVLNEFLDMKPDYVEIVALWIIGTWFHREFETYPYLFINAMKGSGKTRLLKLIKELSWKGDMLSSLSEAVLFRTEGTLCIDEFEDVGKRDKNNLRELLNTAYKKGGKVKRMKKVKRKGIDGNMEETYDIEEFNTFRPIAMANIWGIEEVLGDRCLTIILEKSSNKKITRKIENFTNHTKILGIKQEFSSISVVSAVYRHSENIYKDWNTYIDNYTLNTTHTINTQNSTQHNNLFKTIYETDINGRDLELTFSLFLIAEEIGITEKIIEIIKRITESKKEEDVLEGRDVMLYQFIAKQEEREWLKIRELTTIFRSGIDYDREEDDWCNAKWMGKALKRLNLILSKRRMAGGIEVILDIKKAIEKMEMFK